jgi:hypothetical protein
MPRLLRLGNWFAVIRVILNPRGFEGILGMSSLIRRNHLAVARFGSLQHCKKSLLFHKCMEQFHNNC